MEPGLIARPEINSLLKKYLVKDSLASDLTAAFFSPVSEKF
jgi:hypothetical protein